MSPRVCICGHRNNPRHRCGDKTPLNRADLVDPPRLVALLVARPELAGIGLARVAAAVCEGA